MTQCVPEILSNFHRALTVRDEDPVLAQKPDPGLCTSNEGRFSKVYCIYILDNLYSFVLCFKNVGVRRPL